MSRLIMPFLGFIILISCEKEAENYKIFRFSHSEFVGEIMAYDSLCNQIENNSNFIKNHFLFEDDSDTPYDYIKIFNNDTVYYYFTSKELLHVLTGFCKREGTNIQFYKNYTNHFSHKNEVHLFDGNLVNNKIEILAYGYKAVNNNSNISYACSFGILNIDSLINNEKLSNPIFRNSIFYFQKFKHIYEN